MIKCSHYFILVPKSIGTPKRFFLDKRFLNIFLYAFLALIILSSIAVYFHLREFYYLKQVAGPILKENRELHIENCRLTEEKQAVLDDMVELKRQTEKERQEQARALALVYEKLESLQKFATDLKIMAGFKLPAKKARALGKAQGGPELPMKQYYEDLFKLHGLELLRGLAERRQTLLGSMGVEKEKLSSLRNYLETKKSLLAGTPKGYPVKGEITSGFGIRGRRFHPGIDIAAPRGTTIRATADGVVVLAAYCTGYGRMIELDHGKGFTTRYGHLLKFANKVGDRVLQGETIGYVGKSGRATGYHLHYEVRVNDIPVNPERYLAKGE